MTHNFNCNKCKLKFSFDSETTDINEFRDEMGGIKCPKCSDVWGEAESNIEQIMAVVAPKIDKEKMRRLNRDASKNAEQQALAYRQQNPEQFQTETIKRSPGMGAPTKTGSAVESVPKSVVDRLKDSVVFND